MNIINNKIRYTLVLLFMSIAAIAQPPDPGGGVGGVGPGQRASSIDMYAYVLILIAVVFAIYYAKNYVKKLAK